MRKDNKDSTSSTMDESTSEQAKSSTNHSPSPGKDPQTISEEEELRRQRRAKNTEAARKSRRAKAERIKSLEQQVARLISKNNELETDVKILEVTSSIESTSSRKRSNSEVSSSTTSTTSSSSRKRSNSESSSTTIEPTPSRKRSNCDPQTISDELAKKRAKNAEAARRSRQAKTDKISRLEKQVANLTVKNNELETDIKILQVEKKGLKEKIKDNNNTIRVLECKLAEAYERMINKS